MATRLRLAALGHTMERGKVVEWYVSEGGEVVEGAPLFAVETDKAVVDVEAPAGGVLLRVDAPVDREYPVGATLAWIGEAGEALPERDGRGRLRLPRRCPASSGSLRLRGASRNATAWTRIGSKAPVPAAG